MLKRYEGPDRIRWVGKAWEIKRSLAVLQRQKGGAARLADLLPSKRRPAAR